jgi:hypothetical protein
VLEPTLIGAGTLQPGGVQAGLVQPPKAANKDCNESDKPKVKVITKTSKMPVLII